MCVYNFLGQEDDDEKRREKICQKSCDTTLSLCILFLSYHLFTITFSSRTFIISSDSLIYSKFLFYFFCTFIVVVVADDDVVENFNPSLGKFKRGRRHDVGCFLSEEKLIKKLFF